jgi:hypothetical protein
MRPSSTESPVDRGSSVRPWSALLTFTLLAYAASISARPAKNFASISGT